MTKIERIDNNELKEALVERDDIYKSLYTEFDDDEGLKLQYRLNHIEQYKRDILFLYSVIGATKTAKLFGISRGYVYTIIQEIREEIFK